MHIMWMPDSPSLIEVYKEHKVISKHSNAVGGWHDNDEGKDIINECVEGLEKKNIQHFYMQALNLINTCRVLIL